MQVHTCIWRAGLGPSGRTLAMKDTPVAISDLSSKWETLHDLDRALAVRAIHRACTSLRALAKELPCSPTLLRHLLKALQAPPEDQLLARQGKITINELVRRAKGARTPLAVKPREDLEHNRTQASLAGCQDICDWLRSEDISRPCGISILTEARSALAGAEKRKLRPRDAAPQGTPVAEIIQKCRPLEPMSDEHIYVVWFARWLSLWTAYSIPDSGVRSKAFEMALEKQKAR